MVSTDFLEEVALLNIISLAPPWPAFAPSNEKLDHLLNHIKDVGRKVSIQGKVITQLKIYNVSLSARVDALEVENHDHRQAADGDHFFV